jgi:hypothetical protein
MAERLCLTWSKPTETTIRKPWLLFRTGYFTTLSGSDDNMTWRLMKTDQSVEWELAEETDTRGRGAQLPLILPQITHDLTSNLTQVAEKLPRTAYCNNHTFYCSIVLWLIKHNFYTCKFSVALNTRSLHFLWVIIFIIIIISFCILFYFTCAHVVIGLLVDMLPCCTKMIINLIEYNSYLTL